MFLFATTLLFATPLESNPDFKNDTWMGTLSLSVYPDGASFLLQGYVSQETWVPLPGETGTWPYLVQEEEKNLLNHKVINLEEMNLEERANNELKKNEQTGRTWKS